MAKKDLKFEIVVDTKTGSARVKGLSNDIKKLGGTADKASRTGVAGFAGLATKMFAVTAAVGAGVVAFNKLGAVIQKAIDVEESESLFRVSLGKMAGVARAWSKELSRSLGLNEFELRRNVGILFNMSQSMGIAEDAAFDMSKGLVKLAHDMASFFNLKPEEAFDKLRAGITGEAEPLKRLGILVDETTVKQVAWRNGIARTGRELTQQQKVLARYQAILEQTSKAQGDLARTADSPANKIRRLQTRVDVLSTKFGQALLPSVNSILDIFDRLTGKTDELSENTLSLSKALNFPVAGFLMFGETANWLLARIESFNTALLRTWKDMLMGIRVVAKALPGITFQTTLLNKAILFMDGKIKQSEREVESYDRTAEDFTKDLIELADAIKKVGKAAKDVADGPAPVPGGSAGVGPGGMPRAPIDRFASGTPQVSSPFGSFGIPGSAPPPLNLGGSLGQPSGFGNVSVGGGVGHDGMAIGQLTGPMLDLLVPYEATEAFKERLKELEDAATTFSQNFAPVIADSFRELGAAFTQGGAAAIKALGRIVGGLLSQIGRHLIGQGIAEIILGHAPPPFGPRPDLVSHGGILMATGIGMSIGGGALGAIAGRGGGGRGASPQGTAFDPISVQSSNLDLSAVSVGGSGSPSQPDGTGGRSALDKLAGMIAVARPGDVVVRGTRQYPDLIPQQAFGDIPL